MTRKLKSDAMYHLKQPCHKCCISFKDYLWWVWQLLPKILLKPTFQLDFYFSKFFFFSKNVFAFFRIYNADFSNNVWYLNSGLDSHDLNNKASLAKTFFKGTKDSLKGLFKKYVTENFWTLAYFNALIRTSRYDVCVSGGYIKVQKF